MNYKFEEEQMFLVKTSQCFHKLDSKNSSVNTTIFY